ncbi:hypothetical protein [Vibrio phage vB_VhaS-a]|nr:hypothetical protein [Vibrio phage vB_VhaS-a]
MSLTNEEEARLHRRLVKLGDAIGDGVATPEMRRDYRATCKLLGYDTSKPRQNNSERINKIVEKTLQGASCPKCGGTLKQSRKGSYVIRCLDCEARLRVNVKKVRKNG